MVSQGRRLWFLSGRGARTGLTWMTTLSSTDNNVVTMPQRRAPSVVLGEFELVVLLAVLRLDEHDDPAYGSTIRDEIAARANRSIARGAVYVTLDRLERKGLLVSKLADPSRLRDNRPKRLFTVTPTGLQAVRNAVTLVNRLQEGVTLVMGTR
jgi:PadR family transcriptional regulator PadR